MLCSSVFHILVHIIIIVNLNLVKTSIYVITSSWQLIVISIINLLVNSMLHATNYIDIYSTACFVQVISIKHLTNDAGFI